MNNVFFIGDTHFGHNNIIGYNRPEFNNIEEMHEAIIERWNNVVRPKDVVYHVGDVFFGKDNWYHLCRLNGTKHLILGNHDVYDIQIYANNFKHIFGALNYKNCIVTHVPIHPQQFYRFKLNIHGHVHHKDIVMCTDTRYYNVNADHVNLTPVAWETIKAERNI